MTGVHVVSVDGEPRPGHLAFDVNEEFVIATVGQQAWDTCQRQLALEATTCSISLSPCVTLAVFRGRDPTVKVNGPQCGITTMGDAWLMYCPGRGSVAIPLAGDQHRAYSEVMPDRDAYRTVTQEDASQRSVCASGDD